MLRKRRNLSLNSNQAWNSKYLVQASVQRQRVKNGGESGSVHANSPAELEFQLKGSVVATVQRTTLVSKVCHAVGNICIRGEAS